MAIPSAVLLEFAHVKDELETLDATMGQAIARSQQFMDTDEYNECRQQVLTLRRFVTVLGEFITTKTQKVEGKEVSDGGS